MNEGLIKDAYEAVIKELQVIISVAYIIIVGIGMLFNFQKYDEFGINIFEYADVFDFLLAPFSDFFVLLYSIVSLLVSGIILWLDSRWKKKSPNSYSKASFGFDKKSWFTWYRTISFVVLIIAYLFISADLYGSITKKKIVNQSPVSITFADNEVQKGILIGKTTEILFLLKEDKVYAIPITSLVKEFEIR